jgi:hypothetical protein
MMLCITPFRNNLTVKCYREDTSVLSRFVTTDGDWIGNRIYWTLTEVTTNNYDSLTELHTPEVTVTTSHTKSSHSSLAVAW